MKFGTQNIILCKTNMTHVMFPINVFIKRGHIWSVFSFPVSLELLDIDDCLSQPCVNGGTCVDGANFYSCMCLSGFSGLTCQFRGKIYKSLFSTQTRMFLLCDVTCAYRARFLVGMFCCYVGSELSLKSGIQTLLKRNSYLSLCFYVC